MDWSAEYYVLWALGIGLAAIVLTLVAALFRVRIIPFVIAGLLICGAGAVYLAYGPNSPPAQPGGEAPTPQRSQQPAGQSTAGRTQSGESQSETQRAAEIEHTEHPTSVSEPQRDEIRQALARLKPDKRDQVDFSLVIGSAVPRDIKLDDLPADITDSLHGYDGDQFLVVQDQLVIVDHQSRRVVALIPGVA